MTATETVKHTSSRLNRTPPTGAPKATDTPAAAAADNTYWRIQKIHRLYYCIEYIVQQGVLTECQ